MQHKKSINKSRRRFIIGLSLAGVASGTGASGIYALKNHQSPDYSDEAYSPWQQSIRDSISDEQYMAQCATLAPSPHNTQPWRFKLQEGRIEIHADMNRLLGNADPDLRQMHQGLGCALQNILVAAGYLGYNSEVTYIEDENSDLVAVIELKLGEVTVSDSEFQSLFSRQTNRSPYDLSIDVPQSLLDGLVDLADQDVGISFHRIGEESTAYLRSYMRTAVRNLVADDKYYLDSIKWWRYTREELVGRRDGISIHTSDAPFFVKEGMEQFVDVNTWTGEFGRQGEIDVMDNLSASTPVWGVIWGKQRSRVHRVKAGQMLERAYLAATNEGLYVHPISYPAESPVHAQRLLQRFEHPESSELLSVFRLGGAAALERSPRISWQEKLVA